MIIVNLKGGLGNQMFQYATGRAIALRNNTELKLDISGYANPKYNASETPRSYELADFLIKENIASAEEIKKLKYPFGVCSKLWRFLRAKVLQQNFLDYHPEIFNKKEYYLDGFWQSEKNFSEIRDVLLQEFTFKEGIDTSIIESDSLSMHVRRGDYATNPKTRAYHGLVSKEYYKKAFDCITEKTPIQKVYIFSDDPAWVRDNFDFIDVDVVYVSDMQYKPGEEIILMSKCTHNIIANSSFSWWGAWLNQDPDKIVIAPQNWLRSGDAPHYNIIPKTWIRM
jgi:hypothetical protein